MTRYLLPALLCSRAGGGTSLAALVTGPVHLAVIKVVAQDVPETAAKVDAPSAIVPDDSPEH